MSKTVFKNKFTAAAYINSKLMNRSPLKLQLALYFLWSFYAAEIKLKKLKHLPQQLFNADWYATDYGPRDKQLWKKKHLDDLTKIQIEQVQKSINQIESLDLNGFITNLINQINHVNDFGLVNRAKLDDSYKTAYRENQSHKMNQKGIIKDYIQYIK